MTQTVDTRDLFSHSMTLGQREDALRWVLSAFLIPPIRGGRVADYADFEERRKVFDLVAGCIQDFEKQLLGTLIENTRGNTDLLADAMATRNAEGDSISGWLLNKADVSGVFG